MIDMMHKEGEAPADPSCPHLHFLPAAHPMAGSHRALPNSQEGRLTEAWLVFPVGLLGTVTECHVGVCVGLVSA